MPVYNVELAGKSTFLLVVLELLPSDAADYGVPLLAQSDEFTYEM